MSAIAGVYAASVALPMSFPRGPVAGPGPLPGFAGDVTVGVS